MDKNFKNQEKRISLIFLDKTEDLSKRMETIKIYKEYLNQNLSSPIELTGIEDFSWEEFYVLGPGSEEEYEKLKESNPSFTDIYNLIAIDDFYDEYHGLIANVTRICDKKIFQVPLCDLMSTNIKSKNHQLLDDYSAWSFNY